MRSLDESMEAHKMDTGGPNGHRPSHLCIPHTPGQDTAMPPNLLYFKILLEGIMGYRIGILKGEKRHLLPRWSVMGGAVVAALTAWRKERIRKLFTAQELDLAVLLLAAVESDDDQELYWETKHRIVHQINLIFMYGIDPQHPGRRDCYPKTDQERTEEIAPEFSDGNVDIFLQVSEETFRLQKTLSRVLPRDVLKCVEDFLGGSYVREDLRRFADCFLDGQHLPHRPYAYALAKNSLSFMGTLNVDDWGDPVYYDTATEEEGENWPRSTQLIMLNKQADLVGGLMDFDISVATCAYNANGVFVTPRAALSLLTNVVVVTPFCCSRDTESATNSQGEPKKRRLLVLSTWHPPPTPCFFWNVVFEAWLLSILGGRVLSSRPALHGCCCCRTTTEPTV